MKIKYKILLLIEIFVLFAAPTIMLFGSIFYSNITLYKILNGKELDSIFGWLFINIGGVLGMVAIISLLIKIMLPNRNIPSPRKIIFFIIMGVIPIILAAYFILSIVEPNFFHLFVFLFPIIGSAHLMYLNRVYLFKLSANKSFKPTPKSGAV